MSAETKPTTTGLALLRAAFPPHQISKLPKPTKAQTEAVKTDYKKGARCALCGAWHHPDVVHLDYVGHAALTDRLLDADPNWTWEPLAMSDGLPVFDGFGGMWIKLTVCGVTRLGYGDATGKDGANAIKEVIGDALRNAAMRFGAALDLWHKGDLHGPEDDDSPKDKPATAATTKAVRPATKTAAVDMSPKARALRVETGVAAGDASGAALAMAGWPTQEERDAVWALLQTKTQQALSAVWPDEAPA